MGLFERERRQSLLSLGPPLLFVPVYAAYLYTHPYPAFAGGLFLTMAETVSEAGYLLPARIPYYTEDGIPFGYPPLAFYGAGFLLDVGVSKFQLARVVPGLVLLVTVPVYQQFAQRLLGDRKMAAFTAVVLVTSPAVLELTLSAGGFVRATGLLVTAAGLGTGVRTFRDDSWRYAVASAVLFGVVVLTHPKYALFFGLSFVVFFLSFGRTVAGLSKGVAVAVGGALVASPWWVSVWLEHGVGIFLQAGGTHGGVVNPVWVLEFLAPHTTVVPSLWPFLVALGGVYLVARREWVLPLWFLATGFVVGNDEHLMVVGALVVTRLLFEAVSPSLVTQWRERDVETALSTVGVALVVLAVVSYSVCSATLYVEEGLVTDDEFVSFVHDDDVETMQWARENTRRQSTFVVVGDVAEWFPLVAQRTSLVAARGSEWDRETSYSSLRRERTRLSGCLSADCLTAVLEDNDWRPDYVYVPTDGYVRGNNRVLGEHRRRHLLPSLNASGRYALAFETNTTRLFRYEVGGH